jgi:hypothetical protein
MELIERYDLHGQDVVEIGCGDGHFLGLLCQRSGGHGLGFDPGYGATTVDRTIGSRVTVVPDVYSERYLTRVPALVCCRHVLEHLDQPGDLLRRIRSYVGDAGATALFFEVPNALSTLKSSGVWDIIYEHSSYFTPSSLSHLFHNCGFDVRGLRERYGGQFLTVDALARETSAEPVRCPGSDPQGLAELIQSFGDGYRRIVASWRRRLERMTGGDRRIVLWGAGSKGVMFLNTVSVAGQIAYAVDVNPRKQGAYVTGTGQRIVHPGFLRDYDPDVVLVMNRLYLREIRHELESLNVNPELVLV